MKEMTEAVCKLLKDRDIPHEERLLIFFLWIFFFFFEDGCVNGDINFT